MKRCVTFAGLVFLAACGSNDETPNQSTPKGSKASKANSALEESHRRTLNFNTQWLFAGDVPGQNGQAVSPDAANESSFVPVTLPYFRLHPHKSFNKIAFEVPVSWYRRHFTLPSSFSGRRVAIE